MTLKDYELDNLAAECAVPIAAAFAAAGWTWRRGWGDMDDALNTPDAARLAVGIRRRLDDVEMERSLSSGRIMVCRYIDAAVEETVEVWLHVGTLHARGDVGTARST